MNHTPDAERGSHSEPRQPGTTDAGGTETDTQALAHDIEQTRAEMSETIAAIEEQLQPERLKEEARQAVRERTIGRAERAVQTTRQRATEIGSGLVARARPLARQLRQQQQWTTARIEQARHEHPGRSRAVAAGAAALALVLLFRWMRSRRQTSAEPSTRTGAYLALWRGAVVRPERRRWYSVRERSVRATSTS